MLGITSLLSTVEQAFTLDGNLNSRLPTVHANPFRDVQVMSVIPKQHWKSGTTYCGRGGSAGVQDWGERPRPVSACLGCQRCHVRLKVHLRCLLHLIKIAWNFHQLQICDDDHLLQCSGLWRWILLSNFFFTNTIHIRVHAYLSM